MKNCLLLLFACLWSAPLRAQPVPPEPLPGSTGGFHQTHTGQILFSPTTLPAEEYPGAAHIGLSTYALGPQSSLNFTAFLGASLAQVLHRLTSRLPLARLATTGTYQFRFYVDARLVYLANLPAGAMDPTAESTATVLREALIDEQKKTGGWGQSLWRRFLANGGNKALTQGQHLLRLEIRPYFQHPLLRDAPVLAAGQVALDVTVPMTAKMPR